MFRFADYLNRTMAVEICGKTIRVKQPSLAINRKIANIEMGITSDNLAEKRVEVLQALVNNNTEEVVFGLDELQDYPVQAVNDFVQALNQYFGDPENDPN